MPNYLRPAGDVYISDSWQGHRNRKPPSSEAGTDYACAYGTPIKAPHDAIVDGIKTTNSGAGGRAIMLNFRDRNWGRALHLSSVKVSKGQVVSQGQIIGYSGASANGNDYGVGAHTHWSWWQNYGTTPPSPGSTLTQDFEAFLGTGGGSSVLEPDQRRTQAITNGRAQPTSQSATVGEPLQAGVVGNFLGWINGESVSGNKVWFKGTSGRWFWSGGFEGTSNTRGLTDLNTPTLGATQRQAVSAGANGRAQPTTTATIVATLGPDAIGTFVGWINGETVSGNPVWFKGVDSGAWFWSGGFVGGANVSGLADMNIPATGEKQRTVGANSANGRSSATTSAPVTQSLSPGTVADMDGYTKGETVSANDVWFRGAHSGDWFWSGGFVGGANVEGLSLLPQPTLPDANNPRGLTEYPPINPNCDQGVIAPLGDGLRGTKGVPPVEVPVIIDRAIIHHTGTTQDQMDFFSYKNGRSSCPNVYVRPDGWKSEMIRPSRKPASTGPEWNWRSYAWEVLDAAPAPLWTITDAAKHAVAEDIVWLAEHDGLELDGVLVEFKIDAVHIIGHNQALPGTECPGPDMNVPGIIALAQQLWDEKYPEQPIPPEPQPDTVVVEREALLALQHQLNAASTQIDAILA